MHNYEIKSESNVKSVQDILCNEIVEPIVFSYGIFHVLFIERQLSVDK